MAVIYSLWLFHDDDDDDELLFLFKVKIIPLSAKQDNRSIFHTTYNNNKKRSSRIQIYLG